METTGTTDGKHYFYDVLDQAVKDYQPTHAFCFFSGGNDSLVSTHLSMNYMRAAHGGVLTQVCHINTGIGIEQTREFVRSTCFYYDWPLVEYKTDPAEYDRMVTEFGFPGPPQHKVMYITLKERRLWDLIRDHRVTVSGKGKGRTAPRRNRILFITGVRKQESRRRMGTVEPIQAQGPMVWVAPIIDWTKDDCLDYKETYGLPVNEVVDVMHMSGECLCGAFAIRGELDMLRTFYPDTAARIDCLQDKARQNGHTRGWEDRLDGKVRKSSKFNTATLCVACSGKEDS